MKKERAAYCVCVIRGTQVAVPVAAMEGVTPTPVIVPVPRERSRFIRGIVYVFGSVMPVIDITPLLNTEPQRDGGQLVVMSYANERYAFMVESVGEVVSDARLQQTNHHPRIPSDGFIVQNKKRIYILAIDRILSRYVCN